MKLYIPSKEVSKDQKEPKETKEKEEKKVRLIDFSLKMKTPNPMRMLSKLPLNFLQSKFLTRQIFLGLQERS